jgi:hypothetical protein
MMATNAARGWIARARTEVTGPREIALVVRMSLWSCAIRLLKHVLPLSRLVDLVRREPNGRTRSRREEKRVVTLARWTSRLTQWSAQGPCLERALITYRYLTSMNAGPVLVVGVVPGERTHNGSRGHAWVTVDGVPVDESDDSLGGFVTLVAFGPDGRPIAS